jgi:hypothetical protein
MLLFFHSFCFHAALWHDVRGRKRVRERECVRNRERGSARCAWL